MSRNTLSRKKFLRYAATTGAGLALSSIIPVTLVGCGAQKKITLRVVSTEGDPKAVEVAKKIGEAFTKQNPNVLVNNENIPWGDFLAKAMAAASANEDFGIQLSWDAFMGELASKGLLAPVDDIIDKIGRSDFKKASLLKYEGNQYILPYFLTASVLFYRADLFGEKGLNPPVTWDDFAKACEAFTEDTNNDGTINRWGCTFPWSRTHSVHNFILPFLKSNGGYLLAEDGSVVWDSRQNIETIEYLKSLLPYAPPGWSEASWGEEISNYYVGATAMARYAGRLLSRTKEFSEEIYQATQCVPMPTPNGRKEEQISLVEVAGICIWKDVSDLDTAKDYAHSFLTGDSYMDWVHTVVPHYLPPRQSVMNNPKYWEHPILQEKRACVETMLEVLETGTDFMKEYGDFNIQGNMIYNSVLIQDCIQEIMVLDAPVAETMKKYAQQMRDLIA